MEDVMFDVKISPQRTVLKSGKTEFSIELTICLDGVVTDIIAFPYDRKSLSSFTDARRAAYWCHYGLCHGTEIIERASLASKIARRGS